MKIAIPCENGEVMQHFSRAQEFNIYSIEDIKPIDGRTPCSRMALDSSSDTYWVPWMKW